MLKVKFIYHCKRLIVFVYVKGDIFLKISHWYFDLHVSLIFCKHIDCLESETIKLISLISNHYNVRNSKLLLITLIF